MLQANTQQSKIWAGLAATVIATVALIGCGGGEDTSTAPPVAGSGGAQLPAGGGGQMPGMSSGGGTPAAGMPAAGQPAQGQARVASTDPAMAAPKARKDPFRPWFSTVPPPPPAISLVDPVRIAMSGTAEVIVQPGIEIQEVPSRRVAGILTGNGVYALFDTGQVVKPGDLTDDGYRVVMINSNSVTLQKKVESQTFTQVVPLTDAGSQPMAAAPAGRGGTPFGRGGRGFGPGGFGPPGGPGASGSSGSSGGPASAN